MKILFITSSFRPQRGGVETHTWEVVQRLIEKGHDVIIITEKLPLHPSPQSRSEVKGFQKTYRLHFGDLGFFKKFRIWFEIFKHRQLIEQADIVHCHDVFFWYLPFRFLYPTKPVYTTFHGYETRFPPTKKAVLIRKLSEKLSWGTIAVGDYIRKWYGAKPDYVMYGAVEQFIDRPHNQQTHKSIPHKPKILLMGRLEKDIGIEMYIETLKILKRDKVPYSLKVCGDGSMRKKVEKYGKVHGFVNNINPFIKRADIIFASSYLSILEALSFGKPVVCVYNNPLKEDYLKMSPFAKFAHIENDPQEVALKIEHKHIKIKNLSQLKDFLKSLNWNNITETYLELWQK